MTIETILSELKKCDPADYVYTINKDNDYLEVTFDDFNDRFFNDGNAADRFMEYLDDTCNSKEDFLDEYYYYDGFTVEVSYTSCLDLKRKIREGRK